MDCKAFHDFEHAGWQRIPKQYHEAFADLTAQAIGPLLDAVGAGRGVRLLDVASGPGYVAAAAAERDASVIGVDFSAAMVAEARAISWHRVPGRGRRRAAVCSQYLRCGSDQFRHAPPGAARACAA